MISGLSLVFFSWYHIVKVTMIVLGVSKGEEKVTPKTIKFWFKEVDDKDIS